MARAAARRARLRTAEIMLNVMAHEAEPHWVRDGRDVRVGREPLSAFFIASSAAYSSLVRALDMARSHAREDASCCAFAIGGQTVATRNLAATFGWAELAGATAAAAAGAGGSCEPHGRGRARVRARCGSSRSICRRRRRAARTSGARTRRRRASRGTGGCGARWSGWCGSRWCSGPRPPPSTSGSRSSTPTRGSTRRPRRACKCFYDCEAPVAVGRLTARRRASGACRSSSDGGAGIFPCRAARSPRCCARCLPVRGAARRRGVGRAREHPRRRRVVR